MPLQSLRAYLQRDAAGAPFLVSAALIALLWANSSVGPLYERLLEIPVAVQFGTLVLAKPLLLWINDGLMAVFFLGVGLEVKREIFEGHLSSLQSAALPCVAALGGMIVPVAIYAALNWNGSALKGWAIPAATDIAFAVGVLDLLGPRVPRSLKVFLLALAIIDDLGAILVIAAFYTSELSTAALLLAALAIAVLIVLNRLRITSITPYILVGIFLWVCVLKSGVHATLAGVALAFTVPLRPKGSTGSSPLRRLEEGLHPWITFAILPLFAFGNAGVSLADVSVASVLEPVPLGIALGLFLGKQIGVFLPTWGAIRLRPALMPEGANRTQIYGLSALAGIGFTMSFFIGSLAFEDPVYSTPVRLGILTGSLLSTMVGYGVLFAAGSRR